MHLNASEWTSNPCHFISQFNGEAYKFGFEVSDLGGSRFILVHPEIKNTRNSQNQEKGGEIAS